MRGGMHNILRHCLKYLIWDFFWFTVLMKKGESDDPSIDNDILDDP